MSQITKQRTIHPLEEEGFFPIPDWPGYSIDRLGRVCGKAGVLSCDPKGRVRLRNGKGQSLHYVGALMIQAGLLTPPSDAPAAPVATPATLPPEIEDELLALRSERDTLEQQVDGLREELTTAMTQIERLTPAAPATPVATPELPPDPEGELLALRSERDALERQVDDLRKELATASETIARGRKLNGHLLAQVRKQEAEAVKPKKRRPWSAPDAHMNDMPSDFDEAFW